MYVVGPTPLSVGPSVGQLVGNGQPVGYPVGLPVCLPTSLYTNGTAGHLVGQPVGQTVGQGHFVGQTLTPPVSQSQSAKISDCQTKEQTYNQSVGQTNVQSVGQMENHTTGLSTEPSTTNTGSSVGPSVQQSVGQTSCQKKDQTKELPMTTTITMPSGWSSQGFTAPPITTTITIPSGWSSDWSAVTSNIRSTQSHATNTETQPKTLDTGIFESQHTPHSNEPKYEYESNPEGLSLKEIVDKMMKPKGVDGDFGAAAFPNSEASDSISRDIQRGIDSDRSIAKEFRDSKSKITHDRDLKNALRTQSKAPIHTNEPPKGKLVGMSQGFMNNDLSDYFTGSQITSRTSDQPTDFSTGAGLQRCMNKDNSDRIEAYGDNRCPKGHPLIRSNEVLDCDGCGSRFELDMSLCCPPCGYGLCDKCLRSMGVDLQPLGFEHGGGKAPLHSTPTEQNKKGFSNVTYTKETSGQDSVPSQNGHKGWPHRSGGPNDSGDPDRDPSGKGGPGGFGRGPGGSGRDPGGPGGSGRDPGGPGGFGKDPGGPGGFGRDPGGYGMGGSGPGGGGDPYRGPGGHGGGYSGSDYGDRGSPGGHGRHSHHSSERPPRPGERGYFKFRRDMISFKKEIIGNLEKYNLKNDFSNWYQKYLMAVDYLEYDMKESKRHLI